MPVQIRGVRVTRRRVVSVACGYVAAVAALAALLFALSGAHAARTGVSRRVYAAIGFSGTPVLSDASPAVSIDFLDESSRPAATLLQRALAWFLVRAGNGRD